jgi:hypothetical protein
MGVKLGLSQREEQRLRVFENRVLRRVFGPKRDEATGEWRRLHNEELNDLYSSPNIIIIIIVNNNYNQIENDMGGECSTYGGKERCIQDFGGET